MNFLKKLGMIVGNIAGVVAGLGPLFSKALPGQASEIQVAEDVFGQGIAIVQTVEVGAAALADKNLTGPDKLKAATPIFAQAVLQSAFMIGKKIADPEKFKAACATIVGGIADLQSSLHEDSVQHQALPK